jgi:hypothetical protein
MAPAFPDLNRGSGNVEKIQPRPGGVDDSHHAVAKDAVAVLRAAA